jgi:uroporphyrin-III C-methyltransferase / precorrin-2 dehydrogenase / sirohydrochlorin ferrochelatase
MKIEPRIPNLESGRSDSNHITDYFACDSLKGISKESKYGEVFLVGAGPGDPELLTVRALRLIQSADVVVYDALVSDEVMALVNKKAELIYVGKTCANHTLPQKAINTLLIKLAIEERNVVRLKGGDPFIFGRGGEEIETLAAWGIPFQVVPGISAANGVSSYAGIPLTHRDYAQSVLFTTGHLKDGTVNLDWLSLARPHQTVVIYMGLGGLAEICHQLVQHGLSINLPAAVIQQGTTQKQKVITGTLLTLNKKVIEAKLKSPCLIIIGEVVKLREKLAWFSPKNVHESENFVPNPQPTVRTNPEQEEFILNAIGY